MSICGLNLNPAPKFRSLSLDSQVGSSSVHRLAWLGEWLKLPPRMDQHVRTRADGAAQVEPRRVGFGTRKLRIHVVVWSSCRTMHCFIPLMQSPPQRITCNTSRAIHHVQYITCNTSRVRGGLSRCLCACGGGRYSLITDHSSQSLQPHDHALLLSLPIALSSQSTHCPLLTTHHSLPTAHCS